MLDTGCVFCFVYAVHSCKVLSLMRKGFFFYTHIYISTIIRHTDIVINVVVKVTSVQNPAHYCFLGCYLSGIFEIHK